MQGGQWTMDERKHMRRYATVTTRTRTPSITIGIHAADDRTADDSNMTNEQRNCRLTTYMTDRRHAVDPCSRVGMSMSMSMSMGWNWNGFVHPRRCWCWCSCSCSCRRQNSGFVFSMDDMEYGRWTDFITTFRPSRRATTNVGWHRGPWWVLVLVFLSRFLLSDLSFSWLCVTAFGRNERSPACLVLYFWFESLVAAVQGG
eukprot:scaffold202593_cov53-Attheya_sp.AAC.1